VKVILLPKSCRFNAWTIISLYGWKFKSWCKIHRTLVSHNLRGWAWRTADRRGLWSTTFRTASTFSGVLTVRLDTPCFFVAEAVVQKLCTQRSIVFRDGILPWRGTLKCRRNFLCVTITDSPFLKKSPQRTFGVEGSTAPWQLKLQNLTLPMIPLPWQLYALPSYTSRSKNVRFGWRTLYND